MENEGTLKAIKGTKRVEWSNQPILTTAQLAEFYGTTAENLRINFFNAQKKSRFVEGKHFFKVEGEALENLRVNFVYLQISPKTRVLYLWTKQGTARHAKMLNTNKAWEVFEKLEEYYFNRPAAKQLDFLAIFADFVALERDKFNFEREHARDDFAKAQLLKDLASASGHNQTLRNSFLKEAGRLLKVKEIEEKIYLVGDESCK